MKVEFKFSYQVAESIGTFTNIMRVAKNTYPENTILQNMIEDCEIELLSPTKYQDDDIYMTKNIFDALQSMWKSPLYTDMLLTFMYYLKRFIDVVPTEFLFDVSSDKRSTTEFGEILFTTQHKFHQVLAQSVEEAE